MPWLLQKRAIYVFQPCMPIIPTICQALDRILNFFPEERHHQILMDLSLNMHAFVSQRLVQTIDGKRTAAFEILLGTQLIRDLIQRGDIHGIKEVMEKSEESGMQTFDNHLLKLFKDGIISKEEALQNSDSRNNLKLKINLCGGLSPASTIDSTDASKSDLVGSFSLQDIQRDD